MKKAVVGILAHVDAGKTTLSEALLYRGGTIRNLGRVDHKNAYLDTFQLERQRGITIFSKQARLQFQDMEMILLDTPGHVDFSMEMERTLQVLDYAILVISGTDGVQAHTETLWHLLKEYHIPTFLFVNKMDLLDEDTYADNKEKLLSQFYNKFQNGVVDFSFADENMLEEVAMCSEEVMEEYLTTGKIQDETLALLVAERKLFPCFFGSALKLSGIDEFVNGFSRCCCELSYAHEFGAKVYKITRDEQGNRLTHLKVTGGLLKVKELLNGEKIDQIRLYSGSKYEVVGEVNAGNICAVTGPIKTYPGQGLGMEEESLVPILEPVMTYQMIPPKDIDMIGFLGKLRQLEEEDPGLHIVWNEALKEIHVQIMGKVQLEILRDMILERFNVEVDFGTGNIVYKETITEAVEGVGHFEPLRHYAEVHLLMEPLPEGSGLIFDTQVSEDELDLNWQRLILTHLAEREHPGVLGGFAITDMHITLVAGKAHLKHTEGGDFRQATYRAVRQGLKGGKSRLLEPFYTFELEVPTEQLGRAMTDIQKMSGTFEVPQTIGDTTLLKGILPIASSGDYMSEVTAYTKGRGRLRLQFAGYKSCHNEEEVLEKIGYDSENDLDNPTGSVFCEHGAGFYVKWDEVPKYMHLKSYMDNRENETDEKSNGQIAKRDWKKEERKALALDSELEAIMLREFGPMKRRQYGSSSTRYVAGGKSVDSGAYYQKYQNKNNKPVEHFVLVDGYNIIFAWDELKELAKDNLDAARGRLMDILCDYQGFTKYRVILVFDAYKVKGNPGAVTKYHNIDLVYTKEAETADMYIEKVTKEIGTKHYVRVATSDGIEQLIIMGHGAMRVSAMEFAREIADVKEKIREIIQ